MKGSPSLGTEWQEFTVDELAEVKTGPFGSALHASDYKLVGTPIITVEHLGERRITRENLPLVGDSDVRRLSAYKMLEGDIVFSRVGSIDRCALVSKEETGWLFSGRLLRLRGKSRYYHPQLLIQIFKTPHFLDQVRAIAVGQTMPSLNTKILNGIKVRIPIHQNEQNAIASSLADVDSLIDSLDRLIAKKKDIKLGAMQQLFTGKTRLPGFSGEWQKKKLEEISQVNPEVLPSTTHPNYEFSYISLEGVTEGRIGAYAKEVFRSAPSRARRTLLNGDVLFGTVRPNLRSHAKYQGGLLNPVASTGFSILRAKSGQGDSDFIFYFVMSDIAMRQIEMMLAGSNYPSVNSSDVASLLVACPEIEEQQAIAKVLSDMDAEIDALVARRDKTALIKTGMMQELLTGKTRLL